VTRLDEPVVIVGAGPAALALALELRRLGLDPSQLRVLDPSGRWFARWDRQLSEIGAGLLRSPLPHHPDPDPLALEHHLLVRGEVVPSSGMSLHATTAQFAAFIDEVLQRSGLDGVVEPSTVTGLQPDADDVVVEVATGKRLRSGQVVLAHNPRRPRMPPWVSDGGHPRVSHAQERGRSVVAAHDRIAVVGGGHGAASLAVTAATAGSHITLVSRTPFRQQKFDVDPGWLSPANLRWFRSLPAEQRVDRALEARRGGTMPSFAFEQLERARRSGGVDVVFDDIVAMEDLGDGVALCTLGGRRIEVGHVVLATGTEPDLADPLIRALQTSSPAPMHAGYPLLSPTLCWPGTGVRLTGPLALSQVGPTAGNLHGHRWAAQVIAAGIFDEGRRVARETAHVATT
jgi:hypothetical protein